MNQQILDFRSKKVDKSLKPKLLLKQPKICNKKMEMMTKNTSVNASAKKSVYQISTKSATKKAKKAKSPCLSPRKHKSIKELKQKINIGKKRGSPKSVKKSQKYKLKQQQMQDYLKRKVEQFNNVTKSARQFEPISHRKEQVSNEIFHIPHEFINQQPLVYSKFQEEATIINKKTFKNQTFEENAQSILLPDFKNISKREWEAIESLKLKNEELTNYVEQLEKAQAKLINQSKLNQENIKAQCEIQKNQLKKEIGQLRQHQTKISELNVSLVQMFNQGKQSIDGLTFRCNQLNQHLEKNRVKEFQLVQQKNNAIRKAQSLQSKVMAQQLNLDKLMRQKELCQSSINNCNIQKQKIKKNAQQMLMMLHQMQQGQEM